MDPLSIASSVVGLTATCLSTCKKLHDLAGEYQDVPAVIAMICSETTIISIGLSELQMKILRRDDLAQAWASKTEIWTSFETALTDCMVVLSCLEVETRSLRSENRGVWAKIKFIWNQDRLKELLVALRGQQTSITFLLSLLQHDTLSDILKEIRKNAPKMKAAASEAQSLRSCNPSVKMDSESIFDNDAANLSFFHHEAASGYEPSELNFVFDDQVINSQAYRRVFVKAQSESQPPHVEGVDFDTETVKEVDKHPMKSQKNATSLGRDSREKVAADARAFIKPWFLKQESENWVDLQIVRPVRPADTATCYGCLQSIAKDHLRALGGTWHVGCFKCFDCGLTLQSGYHLWQEEIGIVPKSLCENDYIRRRYIHCSKCQQLIIGNSVTAFDRWYHAYHFTCDRCDTAFTKESDCYQHNGSIYCMLHFCREAAYYCQACQFPIMGRYSEKDGEKAKWHPFCFELASWGLVLPVSANGRRYLASIQDQSLKHLSCFYQQLHDNRAKDIYLCGSRYMEEFRDILTVCLEASSGATIRQSDTQFAVILTRLSCLFRATWTATPGGNFSFDEGEVGAFTSAFLKHLECYALGFKRSPGVVAQCISDLLKPLLRFCFHRCLQDNHFSWDVKHEQLDQLIKALGYSSFWPYKLESRYSPLPNVYGEQNWRCTICLHEIIGIVLSECSYPYRKLHPDCHSLASRHRSTGDLADCTSPCIHCELEKSNFYAIHSHDIALYEIWRTWHLCLNPLKSHGELIFVDLTEQEPYL